MNFESFVELAEDKGWEETSRIEDDDSWSLTFRDGRTIIRGNSLDEIESEPVNNFFVDGQRIQIESLEEFEEHKERIENEGLWVKINDSAGLAQRAQNREDTFIENLIDEVDTVVIRPSHQMHNPSKDELTNAVETINSL